MFIPAVGEYVIPELLGGPRAQTIGRVLWDEFFQNRDWPPGGGARDRARHPAAAARGDRAASPGQNGVSGRLLLAWLAFGYGFLYLPIAFLLLFSFNNSRLVTRLDRLLLPLVSARSGRTSRSISAALLSLRIAAGSATAGLAARHASPASRWPASGVSAGRGCVRRHCLAAPLVLPDVVTGLSLLLLFVVLGAG